MPAQDVVELTMILPRAAVVQMDQKVNIHKWYARRVRAKATAALASPSANLLPADGMDFFSTIERCVPRLFWESIYNQAMVHTWVAVPPPPRAQISCPPSLKVKYHPPLHRLDPRPLSMMLTYAAYGAPGQLWSASFLPVV